MAATVALIIVATLRPVPGAPHGVFCIRCGELWLADAIRNALLFLRRAW